MLRRFHSCHNSLAFFVRCPGKGPDPLPFASCHTLQSDKESPSMNKWPISSRWWWRYPVILLSEYTLQVGPFLTSTRMVDHGEEDTPRTISRFSTSTSLRMSQAAAHNTDVVPMPRWSSAVGCARVALAVVVLALTAAATSIWGNYDAFGFTLFTVSSATVVGTLGTS